MKIPSPAMQEQIINHVSDTRFVTALSEYQKTPKVTKLKSETPVYIWRVQSIHS